MIIDIRKINLLFFISYSFSLLSCVNQQSKEKKQYSDDPFKLFESCSQYFEITSNDTIIHGNKGTIISIPENCFDSNKRIVKLELKEYYDITEMIIKGLNTLSNGQMLETGGMLYLNVTTLSGEPVIMKKNKQFLIEVPSKKDGMKLFYGNIKENNINWTLKDDTIYSYQMDTTSLMMDDRYSYFKVTKLGWINIDKFIKFENKINLLVNLPLGEEKAAYCLVFKNYNTIIPPLPNIHEKLVFENIPLGEEVSVIGVGLRDTNLYFGIKDISTDSKEVDFPALLPTSKFEIKLKLQMKYGMAL